MKNMSLGLIETLGWVPAIIAADAASKAAVVSLLGYELARAGLVTVKVTGDVAAVQAAVAAGAAAAEQVGRVVTVHVIPRPDRQLGTLQPGPESDLRAGKVEPSPGSLRGAEGPAEPSGALGEEDTPQAPVPSAESQNPSSPVKSKRSTPKAPKPEKTGKSKRRGRGKRED